MADLVAGDVTYAPQTQGVRTVHRSSFRERRVLVKITFGDGAKTYPSGGVPLTTLASDVDLQRNIRRWEIVDSDDGQGIVWKIDHENAKLRGYILGINVDAAGADTLDDFPIDTTAEPLAEAASIGGFGLEAQMNLLGRMAELKAAASAPAAQTLYLYAYGW